MLRTSSVFSVSLSESVRIPERPAAAERVTLIRVFRVFPALRVSRLSCFPWCPHPAIALVRGPTPTRHTASIDPADQQPSP